MTEVDGPAQPRHRVVQWATGNIGTYALRGLPDDVDLGNLIGDIKEARARGMSDADLDQPRKLQRYAQFMLDFVEAENSTGFHAPQEALRILAESIDYARQGQLVLRGADPGASAARFRPNAAASAR